MYIGKNRVTHLAYSIQFILYEQVRLFYHVYCNLTSTLAARNVFLGKFAAWLQPSRKFAQKIALRLEMGRLLLMIIRCVLEGVCNT